MSTCDSFKSPEVEYMDVDDLAVNSIERKTCSKLYISEAEGCIFASSISVVTFLFCVKIFSLGFHCFVRRKYLQRRHTCGDRSKW